MLNEEVI